MNKYIHYILLVIMTLMTTCTFSSCSDESMFNVDSNTVGSIIHAYLPEYEDLSTRVSYNSIPGNKNLGASWDVNDQIFVSNFSSNNLYTYYCQSNDDNDATWTTNNTAIYTPNDVLVAVFNPNTSSTVTNNMTSMSFSGQNGSFDSMKNYDLMLSDKVTVNTTNIDFTFVRFNAFLRIAVEKNFVDNNPENVTLTLHSKGNNSLRNASLNIDTRLYTSNSNSQDDTLSIVCTNTPEEVMINDEDGLPRYYYRYYVVVPVYNDIIPINRIDVIKEGTLRTSHDYSNITLVMPAGYIYQTKLNNLSETNLLPGEEFKAKIAELLDLDKITMISFENQSSRTPINTDKVVSITGEKITAYARVEGTKIIIFSLADVIYANSDASKMFMGCTTLQSFGSLPTLKTTKVKDMSSMFEDCKLVEEIDASLFDTEAVTDMSSMFKGCSRLSRINTTSLFNTSNVTDMSSMFKNCSAIEKMNVPYDIRNVVDVSSMFEGCTNMHTLELNFINCNDKLRNMDAMFKDCSRLENISFSGIKALKVKTVNNLFQNCNQLKKLDISSLFDADDLLGQIIPTVNDFWDAITFFPTLTANVRTIVSPKEANYMFDSCTRLEELNIGWAFYFSKDECVGAFRNFTTESSSKKCTITLSSWCYDAISDNYNEKNTIGFDTSTTITWKNATPIKEILTNLGNLGELILNFYDPTFDPLWRNDNP